MTPAEGQSPLRMMVRGARLSLGAARNEFRYWARLAFDRARGQQHPAPRVSGSYLITTDRGVFHYEGEAIWQVSRVPAFGIAVAEDGTVYLASWSAHHTTVVAGRLDDVLGRRRRSWREIWRLPIAGSNARVHQISVEGDSLWLANTAQNCLTRLDRHTGAWKATIAPFACRYGHPVQSDHNHVNGVLAMPGHLVFSAFKINREAAFGVIGDGRIWLFRYRNQGVHDCAFGGRSFYFCDSYSFWDAQEHGSVLCDNKPLAESVFAKMNAQFVRGLAGTGDELVVGNSFTGSRSERFGGQGALVVLRKGDTGESCTMPAAQIYDILRTDGRHFDAPPAFASATEVAAHFRQLFGEPVEIMALEDALSGPNVKKFDSRDQGDVAEYMRIMRPAAAPASA